MLGEEARRRLSGHHPARDTQIIALSAINPPGPLEQSRGTQVCVSAKVGGRERSDRWKGESEAFSLQEVDAGNERADESQTRALPGVNRDRTLRVILLAILGDERIAASGLPGDAVVFAVIR